MKLLKLMISVFVLTFVSVGSVSAANGDAEQVDSNGEAAQQSETPYGKAYSQIILKGVNVQDTFIFNDTNTTKYGPAYADITTNNANFLQCLPPGGRKFSYALCYYSGPQDPTGNNTENPSLPCVLEEGGTVANCSCYEISTDVVSPKMPYLVDINAISNLEIYKQTIEACGHNGEKCASNDIIPPVCDAINTNLIVPGADLVSVFSPIYSQNYVNPNGEVTTSCTNKKAGKYAGCMTAPCYRTGEKDAAGHNIVQCKCPVFDGPYQIGQGGQSCNANDPVADRTTASDEQNTDDMQTRHIWSAAYSVSGDNGDFCLPDFPGSKGCGLYKPEKDYSEIINPEGGLCQNVCQSYGNFTDKSGLQVPYTCDATMCTTLGIGQEHNPLFPPPLSQQLSLLAKSCQNIQSAPGLGQIMLVESLAECSCCASQVCGCDNINQKTDEAIYNLNNEQRNDHIETQCQINDTLCGSESE
jgi:hypothetical protein